MQKMKRYMFYITLAQWCIAKCLEGEILPGCGSASDNENVPALMNAFSELNVARGCGQTEIVPPSVSCHTQLTAKQLAKLEVA